MEVVGIGVGGASDADAAAGAGAGEGEVGGTVDAVTVSRWDAVNGGGGDIPTASTGPVAIEGV